MIIDIVRHGETDYNVEKRIQGQLDIKLNSNGIIQAEKISDRLKDEEYDVIYSSPLSRAKLTAEKIFEFHSGTKFIFDAKLKERGFGEVEGFLRKDIDGDMFSENSLDFKVPGGESVLDLLTRIKGFLTNIKGEKVLIVCHGQVMRAFIHLFTGNEFYSLKPKNTALFRIEKSGDAFEVLINNSSEHLDKNDGNTLSL